MVTNAVTYKRPKRFSFTGRAGRREWIVTFAWCTLFGVFLAGTAPPGSLPLALPFIVWALAASVRRLHDINWSGWVFAAPYLFVACVAIPWRALIAVSVLGEPGPPQTDPVFSILQYVSMGTLVAVITVLGVMAVWPGTDGPNAYGESS